MKVFIYDLETTGPDVTTDEIVQVAYTVYDTDLFKSVYREEIFVEPSIPILEEATKVHGITMEKVKGKPPFKAVAPKIKKIIDRCDAIGGYNNFTFDDQILERQLEAEGFPVELSEYTNVDVFRLFGHIYPRTLSGTYKLLFDQELVGAHDAMADVDATQRILNFMQSRIPDLEDALKQVFEGIVDRAGFFKKNEEGVVVIAIGKHKGETLESMAKTNRPYLTWVCSEKNSFAKDTKKVALNALNGVLP